MLATSSKAALMRPMCPSAISDICPTSKGVRIMLVLSRKVNEEVIIGDNIRESVVRVAGNRIRGNYSSG